ncbi:DUF5050 domain-containing protein [Peribacillus sp. SCS-37]|uniref:DUF5050 domain-containing protein n=1 Tax=Paraperibacillus esterisolvens TaxID=3115296 RepID=UPI003905F119
MKRMRMIVFCLTAVLAAGLFFGRAEAASDPVYNAIVAGITKAETSIALGRGGTDFNHVKRTYEKVMTERPELFYAPYSFRVQVRDDNAYLLLTYKYSKSQIASMKTKFNAKVNGITAEAKKKKTELEKVFYLHDYVVNNTAYDVKNYDRNTLPDSAFSAYGALIGKSAVCDGYSKAMMLLLNKAGIWAVKVNGRTDQPHSWNLVRVGGKYYHLDATYDDPIAKDLQPVLSYNYFLVPDNRLDDDHIWTRGNYPKAVSAGYSWLYTLPEAVRYNNYIFYNGKSDYKLYRKTITGTGNTKIANIPMYSLHIYKDWIYFIHLADGQKLYKIKTNGTSLTKVVASAVKNVYIKDNYLYYFSSRLNRMAKLPLK